jgi:hypothetical protein
LEEVSLERPPSDESRAIADEEDMPIRQRRCLHIHDEQIYKIFVLQLYLYR